MSVTQEIIRVQRRPARKALTRAATGVAQMVLLRGVLLPAAALAREQAASDIVDMDTALDDARATI